MDKLQFALDKSTFSADKDGRTISGLIVPFGVKPIDGRDIAFAPGDITWTDASHVKLNLDHDPRSAFGSASDLVETDEGILGEFSIPATSRGDEALELAVSGVYDGLSVAVYPKGEGYHLSHVALTSEPAFDQARVDKVAASAQKESDMDKDQIAALVTETVKTELAAVPPREATVSDDDLKAGLARLGFGAVKEELPYRFDAIGGQHNFLQDILHGNGEDKARVDAFIAQVFNVATTDVDDVNPSPTRPDLFVDGVLPSAPIFAAFDKGAIADATPFIVPKFNTATGLVATHTEGTEPTEGTFTTTSQTVTPKAKSGKVEINREVLDAVGNPAVQGLVWAKMLAAFGTELETEAAATVNAASLTELGTVITAAEADAYDVADLTEANLLSAVFIDGSESWDVFLGHRDLFSKLALAPKSSTDLAKRYPMLSPSNANGTVAERYRRLNVGGYDMVPAGALGATNTNGKSIIGSSSAVACWASTPKRIEWEQVAFGTLGLFGYYAGAVIDLARVRKITYNESTSS